MRSLALVLLALALAVPPAPAAAQSPPAAPLRIGTFDSRAVALAWYNSEAGRKELGALHVAMREAKARRDRERIRELEALGPARQQLMHEQVFSNGSIVNLRAALAPQLERVAREAGVALVVSRWELAWSGPAVETVDVTDALVDRIAPSAQARRWIADLKGKEPIPLAEALAIRD